MVTPAVSSLRQASRGIVRYYPRGYSLVEFLLAASLGVLLLGGISSIFVAKQRSAGQQFKQHLLAENLASVLGYIRDDLRRAGYNQANDSPLSHLGSTDIIQLSHNGEQISYLYRHGQRFVQTVIRADQATQKLKMCQEKSLELPSVEQCPAYFSMLDDQLVRLTDFSVAIAPISIAPMPIAPMPIAPMPIAPMPMDESNRRITLSLTVEYADGTASLTSAITVRTRY